MSKLKELLKKQVFELNKFFASRVLRKKYIRHGKCNSCGRCCREIYVKHGNGIIDDEKKFESLKDIHFFYSYLEVIDKTETGLVFRCTKLDPEKGVCTVYDKRATVCRTYPQEGIFMMGGFVSEDCGYAFTPLVSFEKILKKVQKKGKFENIRIME